MSTFADKPVRVFRSRSEELKTRLRRKRSCGRLKAFNSNTDNRSWVSNDNERRRHILELINTYDTTLGNYIPFDELFAALRWIQGLDATLAPVPSKSETRETKETKEKASRKGKEIAAQQKEMSELAKCLTKAGGDLKNENKTLKAEICKLKEELANCEKCKRKLSAELKKFKGIGDSSGGSPSGGVGKLGGSCCSNSKKLEPRRPSLKESCGNPAHESGGCENENRNEDIEQRLCESEAKISELLCEIEGLQKCLEKAECDAIQMLQLIEQQQQQLNEMQVLECKLREVTKQRDMLQSQHSGAGSDCGGAKSVGSCADDKDREICELNSRLLKQSECIASLKEMLMSVQAKGGGGGGVTCGGSCCGGGSLNRSGCGSQQGYSEDLEDTKSKMYQLQSKVSQQATIIVSQRKCLLEQHKYILEQEQLRTQIQNKVRDQSRKQSELVYERNLLRNEIVFLTARLKTYLGKIQVLEKSIEQFFDNTKAQSCPPANSSCDADDEDVLGCGGGNESECDTNADANMRMEGGRGGGCTGACGGGCNELDDSMDMDFSSNKCAMLNACSSVIKDAGCGQDTMKSSFMARNNNCGSRRPNYQDLSSFPEKEKCMGLRQGCCNT